MKFITDDDIRVGAQRTEVYFHLIKDKKIGLVANQTTLLQGQHLADSLTGAGFELLKIFGPEHGFRGNYEAGKEFTHDRDARTGIEIISLYGAHKKPTPEDLAGIEIMIYDIQDVGVRFYTYISTMTYVMEACAENDIPMLILDRPNPNGFYVDGPMLDTNYRSFVGLHPVPVVHGMTTGEYALMVNGEGWLGDGLRCQLTVVEVEGYDHSMVYKLPVPPSPNLPDWQSVYLYPSLGLFEGTIMSVGRGTDTPFRVIGHPDFMIGSFVFTPGSIPGVSENPPYEGVPCYGQNLTGFAENILDNDAHLTLDYIISAYRYFQGSEEFFNTYFSKLAGTGNLKNQIKEGRTDHEIRSSWEKDLQNFMQVRAKYLIYPEI